MVLLGLQRCVLESGHWHGHTDPAESQEMPVVGLSVEHSVREMVQPESPGRSCLACTESDEHWAIHFGYAEVEAEVDSGRNVEHSS